MAASAIDVQCKWGGRESGVMAKSVAGSGMWQSGYVGTSAPSSVTGASARISLSSRFLVYKQESSSPCLLHDGEGPVHAPGPAWCSACREHLMSVGCEGGSDLAV